MTTPHNPPPAGDQLPGPVTPEKIERFRAQVAAVHERLRVRGVDPAHLPDPVEELVKARDGMLEQATVGHKAHCEGHA